MKRYSNTIIIVSLLLGAFIISFTSCTMSSAEVTVNTDHAVPAMPVLQVQSAPVSIEQNFPASIEGINSVEIRSRVDGYLSSIQVEEGAFVKKGQLLFTIDDRPYSGQLRTAEAEWDMAKAQVAKANIEVDRMAALLSKKLVADVQLKTAQANLAIAEADEKRAAAQVRNAKIILDYCRITAPSSGFLGRLHYKLGSLVSATTSEPLTQLSDVHEVYVYFSMSEESFAEWMEQIPGKTVESKIKALPPVRLKLSSGKLYETNGRIELIRGQLEKTSGAVVIRARFNNAGNFLREGNTGTLLIDRQIQNALTIPQEATITIQDKLMVYLVNDSNKVSQQLIHAIAKTPTDFVVGEGLKKGDKVVLSGLGRLQDGMQINPVLSDSTAAN